MLARSTKLNFPSGLSVQTPILITSFSSKGFRFNSIKSKIHSETVGLVKATAHVLTEAALLSAYDLKYYYPDWGQMKKYSFSPQVLFIDSGGYETLDGFDFSEAYRYPIKAKKWTEKHYEKELLKIPQYFSSVIVSYDHGAEPRLTFKKQASRAVALQRKFPTALFDFLIKPEPKEKYIKIDTILLDIGLLSSFQIIGLTEKELGESILERMQNIRRLREALDRASIPAPIHIFGNLDPLTSIFYFMSGAEIFDGLAWLRFSFTDGRSVYDQNIDAVKRRYGQKDVLNKQLSWYENVSYLIQLKHQMQSFVKEMKAGSGEDAFNVFRQDHQTIIEAVKTLYSQ